MRKTTLYHFFLKAALAMTLITGSMAAYAATFSGTYPVGASSVYTNLKQVADSLNAGQVTGNVIFELQADYNGTTGETFPIDFYQFANSGSFTVTIRPAAGVAAVTAGDPGTSLPLIALRGADNLIFDGRQGGAGSSSWIIRNTRATSPGSVFAFINDATFNTLTFLDIEGQAPSSAGLVHFSTSTGTTGNSNNTVSNNLLHERTDATGFPAAGIYSSGTAAASNKFNTITGNHIYNWTAYGVFASSAGNGEGWTITSNHFYNTQPAANTPQASIQFLAGATSHSNNISSNFIGGQAPSAGGAKWTNAAAASFFGIILNVSASTPSTVSNNVIANIALTSTSPGGFSGISCSAGSINITGNTIGSTITPSSITSASSSPVNGINSVSPGTILIQSNNIGNITATGASVNAQVRGITLMGNGPINVSQNTINGLSSAAASTVAAPAVTGILVSSLSSTQSYSNNTIYNLEAANASQTTFAAGITITANGTGTISANRIYDISNNTTASTGNITGIYIGNGNWSVINSQISLWNDHTRDVGVKGIWDAAGSASVNNYFHNSVYIGGSGNTTAKTYAFARSGSGQVNLRNNLLYNERAGSLNFAVGNFSSMPATGWLSNNNFFVTASAGTVNEWGTSSLSFTSWKSVSQGDQRSFSETTATHPPSIFMSAVTGNLKINTMTLPSPTNLESRGDAVGVATDFEGDARPGPAGSVNGGGVAPDIGADEFDGQPVQKDVGLTALISPSVAGCPGNNATVSFAVTNFGADINLATDNITVTSQSTGANPIVFPAVVLNSGTFAAGTTMTVTVSTTYNVSGGGTFIFSGRTTIPGDGSPSNDSLAPVPVTLTPIVTLPVTNNFAGYNGTNLSTVFPDWYEAAGANPAGPSSLWTSQTGVSVAGNITARVNLQGTGAREWIIGPRFTAAATSKLRFKVAVTDRNSATVADQMGSDDAVSVMISTNCGTTWSSAASFTRSSNIPNTLTSQAVDLSAYAGQTIIVAFLATEGIIDNAEDYDFHIDDINIANNIDGFDVGITALTSPAAGPGCYGTNETVSVTLKNYGPETINFAATPVTVTTNLTGPTTQAYTTTISSGTLAPWATMSVTVATNVNMWSAGTYTINSAASITPEYDASNNSMLAVTRVTSPRMPLPEKVDFTGFTGANLNTAFPNWKEGSGASAPTGTTSSWTTQTGVGGATNVTARLNLYTTTTNAWIYSNKFTASPSSQLKFQAAITDWNSTTVAAQMGTDDAVIVKISTDCGLTWSNLLQITKTSGLTTALKDFTVNLGSYAGSEVMIAFHGKDGPTSGSEDYDFHLDNISLRDFWPVDAGAKDVISPAPNQCTGANEIITIKVMNYGTDTLKLASTPMTVNVSVTGASSQTFSTTVTSGVVPPDSSIAVIVTGSADFSAMGTHQITASANVAGDASPINNIFQFAKSFVVSTVSTFPYVQDFEGSVPWTMTQLAGTGQWAIQTGNGTNPNLPSNSGTKRAYFNSFSNTFYGAVSRLTTNCFNFSNLKAPKLEFFISQDKAFPSNRDSILVVVSTNDGRTWSQPVARFSRYNPSFSLPGWKKYGVCLDQFAGESSVKIGFIAKSAFGTNIYLDDVSISETPAPFAGYTTTSANLLCGGTTTDLTVFSYSGAVQWQMSSGGSPFVNVQGATSDNVISPVLWDTTDFRVVTTFNNVCIVTDTSGIVTIEVLPAPQIELGSDTMVCANTVVLDAGAQEPGTTLTWSNGSTDQTISISASGTYYVTGISDYFCETSDTVSVVLNAPITTDAGVDQTICPGDILTITATGGDSFTWSTGESTPSIFVSPATSTTYTVLASSTAGCTATDSVRINVSPAAVVELGSDISQCGTTPVTLSAASAGSTYIWSTGETTANINVSAPGTYYVDVTNTSSGCMASDSIEVSMNPVPAVSLGSDVTQCGGSVVLDAQTAGVTYVWSTGATTSAISVTSTGEYYVTVTNAQGCTNKDTVSITINTIPVADLGSDIASCDRTEILSSPASTGVSYLWSTGQTSPTITVATGGTFWLQVNRNGCIASDTIGVTFSPIQTVDLGNDTVLCNTSMVLDAGAGPLYTWNTGASSQTITVAVSGTYAVKVSSPLGCSASDTISVIVRPNVAANAGPDLSACIGANAQLTATGGASYMWNDSIPGQTITINPTVNATYTVVATDAYGCQGTDEVNVLVNSGPAASFTSTASGLTLTFNNTSANATSYVWSFGDGSPVVVGQSPTHTFPADGTYTVSLTAINSCGTHTTTQVVSVAVGINETAGLNGISVYPVPTTGELTVEVHEPKNDDLMITIFSTDGKMIGSATIQAGALEKRTFRLDEYPSGLYFMQLTQASQTINRKVILQK